MSKKEDVELVTLIEEINEVLKEIKDEQVNQVFERRISSIEALLYEVFKS